MTAHTHSHTDHVEHADDRLVEELVHHHAGMLAELDRLSGDLVRAAGGTGGPGVPEARRALEHWFAHVLVAHAAEEEETSYRAAGLLPEGRLLIRAMLAEHVLIRRLVGLFAEAEEPATAAAYGRAVLEVFDSHQRKENEIILPLLAAEPTVSLGEVMAAGHHHHAHA